MKHRYGNIWRLTVVITSMFFFGGCASLPDNSSRTLSVTITDEDNTVLGKLNEQRLKHHPGLSGIYLLRDGLDAFVARIALARYAERSIDVQYYMFHQDTVGRLLIKELVAAADRGVRIRLLVDDMYGEEGDDTWLALDSLPSFEVRLFNPFVRGHSKKMQFLTRLKTVNHRMHSKTFTVDNQTSIVGGRNIGSEYFNADPNLAFSDVDVMAIGTVVPDVSDEFNEYWNSKYAFPITTLKPDVENMGMGTLRQKLDNLSGQEATSAYVEALNNSDLAKALANETLDYGFAKAVVIYDSSGKLTKRDGWKDELLMTQLAPYIKKAKKELILVSPYFVPGSKGTKGLCALSEQGVKVRILTNSLVSNDVSAVHTGYIRHRKELLRCGIQLYELNEQTKKQKGERFTWLPGLNKSSLHAKTLAIDGEAMFVGSFNFDQRSLNINNEIGILFYNSEIASTSSKNFDNHIEEVAFRVELVKNENGSETLTWTGTEDGVEVVFRSEPYASFWERFKVNFMRILPIDSML
jgi:putative cardiolipin synthase